MVCFEVVGFGGYLGGVVLGVALIRRSAEMPVDKGGGYNVSNRKRTPSIDTGFPRR